MTREMRRVQLLEASRARLEGIRMRKLEKAQVKLRQRVTNLEVLLRGLLRRR